MSREADDRWERLLRRLGLAIVAIQKAADGGPTAEGYLREVRFKLDADNRTSVLVVLKATLDDRELVGFVGAPELESAVIATAKKLAKSAVKWREDRPYGG